MTEAVPDAAPGVRGRLGIIQPAPGLMLEHEWWAAMPPGVAFPVTRLPLAGGRPEQYDAMADQAPAAAAILAGAGAGAIGYACGVGSLHRGPAAERTLMQRLSAAAGGTPVIGMAEAAAAAMHRLGARRVAILTPYADAVNALVQGYLEETGFTPAGCVRLPVDSPVAGASLPADTVLAEAAAAAGAADRADLLWLPCSNVRSLALLSRIEQATGLHAVSSTQALLWRMLRTIGLADAVPGAGRLLAEA